MPLKASMRALEACEDACGSSDATMLASDSTTQFESGVSVAACPSPGADCLSFSTAFSKLGPAGGAAPGVHGCVVNLDLILVDSGSDGSTGAGEGSRVPLDCFLSISTCCKSPLCFFASPFDCVAASCLDACNGVCGEI